MGNVHLTAQRITEHSKTLLGIIIILALIHGFIYVAVIPPWQHHDEPAHFRRLDRVTEIIFPFADADTSLTLPQELIASQCAFDFWRLNPCPTLPNLLEEPPTLRELGVHYQPVYYYILAPFQALLSHTSIETRLYAGRVISVGFYVITVVIAYLTARESFPDLPAFQWVAPALLATLPAYTDKMSALNNDVGSVLVFSFLMWGSVRLIRRGISPLRIIWVISSSAAGVFTKRTALVGVLIAFLAIVLATRDWNWKTLMLGSGALFAAGIPLTLNQSASAHWYIVGGDQTPARIAEDAIMGEHSLRINPGQNLVQEMTRAKQDTLKGKIVTVGGWIRTDAPLTTTVRAISLYDGKQHHRPQMDVDQTWKFHAFTTKVDLQATTLQVRLASEKTKGASQPTSIYFDGIILTMGNFPLDKKPQFDSAQGEQGQWGDNRFNNFIKNASGEQVWLAFRPWVTSIANLSMIRGRAPTLFLQSILDWRRTSWIYQPALKNLFQSFWARFGWNHVGLEDGRYEWIYWVLAGLTMTSFIGISRIFWRRIDLLRQPSTWQERIIVLFISSTLLVLLLTLLGYSHPQLTTVRDVRASVARYAYPAIIPIVILLCLGWHECVPGKWHPYLPLGVLLLGAILDLVSLWGVIIPFYYH